MARSARNATTKPWTPPNRPSRGWTSGRATRARRSPRLEEAFSGLFKGSGGQGGGGSGGGAGGIIAGLVSAVAGAFGFGGGGMKGDIGALQAAGTMVNVFHAGGLVGAGGAMRAVSPGIFAGAPRYHMGGIIGPDEVPAILRRGEVVRTPEQEAALGRRMGGITVNINGVTDANSFRNSQGQIAGRLAAALARTGRNR